MALKYCLIIPKRITMEEEAIHKKKELISILMESSLYFNVSLRERLHLIEDLLSRIKREELPAEVNEEVNSPQAL